MNKKQLQKHKWVSDAAYYKSLKRILDPGSESQDWFEAEQEYRELNKKCIKSGLVILPSI